jgi:hypothetical protein
MIPLPMFIFKFVTWVLLLIVSPQLFNRIVHCYVLRYDWAILDSHVVRVEPITLNIVMTRAELVQLQRNFGSAGKINPEDVSPIVMQKLFVGSLAFGFKKLRRSIF